MLSNGVDGIHICVIMVTKGNWEGFFVKMVWRLIRMARAHWKTLAVAVIGLIGAVSLPESRVTPASKICPFWFFARFP